MEVQPNHDPAIGFVPRRGFRQYLSILHFGPRPDRHPWIRQLRFGSSADIWTDLEDRLLSRSLDFTVFQVEMQSQDDVEVHVIPSYERLEARLQDQLWA